MCSGFPHFHNQVAHSDDSVSYFHKYVQPFSPEDLTLKVLVTTIDAQWEGIGDVGSARYEPALLPRYPTIRILSYSN